mmetsp:Transcript_22911/g.52888  ORF Transcript_22911/g.52888 Transcript_22911/m.52888 type:complete len:234 (+) Transcript_22911:451-1152(+)
MIWVSTGTRSSMGTPSESAPPFIAVGCSCSLPCSPMVPPTNTLTPGTAFILPSAFIFFAGPPISPMSPACTCPHELGQPVQWMRMPRCTATRWSSSFAMASALFFVSTMARPQNWEPVQLTTLPAILPGFTESRDAPLRHGSAQRAARSSSLTFGRITFSSTVSRTSAPGTYLSARSAICRASSTDRRPTGTCTPTRCSDGCGCAKTPLSSRRAKSPVGRGCCTSKRSRTPPP